MAPSYDDDKSNSLLTHPCNSNRKCRHIYFVITVQGIITGNYNKSVHFVKFFPDFTEAGLTLKNDPENIYM